MLKYKGKKTIIHDLLSFDAIPEKRRPWFRFFAILLSIYGATATVGSYCFRMFYNSDILNMKSWYILILFVFFAVASLFFYCIVLAGSRSVLKIKWHINSAPGPFNSKVFLLSSAFFFLPLFVTFLRYYPGGMSPDSAAQWTQVQTFSFDNWHPVFHTLLIWLISRIHNSWAFVTFVQVLSFAIAFGLLYTTLLSYGIPRKLLIAAFAFTVLNPVTGSMASIIWKDCTFAVALIFLMTPMVRIFLSEGKWLDRIGNVIGISIALGMITLLRHNAFFLTVPLIALITIIYFRQKKVRLALPIFLATFLLIRFPLYTALNVTYPEQTVRESIGVPMTILSSVYKVNPDAISPETRTFLLKIAPQESYDNRARFGDYNALKFSLADSPDKYASLTEILQMTLTTIKNAPIDSVASVLTLTDFIWDATGNELFYFSTPTDYKGWGIEPHPGVRVIGEVLIAPQQLLWKPFGNLFGCLGFYILITLLVAVVAFPHIGYKSFMFALPFACYNLGTLLLICGGDYRFFYFNIILALPITLLLLAKCVQKGETVQLEATDDADLQIQNS